jgi:two-component system, LytTR family, response regulator
MSPFQVLLVDDEPLARERLRAFLAREPDIHISGECANGEEALATILRDKPDIVFLDVEMPGLNGLELLEKLNGNCPAAVVFVTAYDQYAVKAFDVHAVDYILKPFDRERLHTAVERAVARVQSGKPGNLQAKLAAILADIHSGATQPERIPVKSGGRVTFVSLNDIDWIGSADNYVELHVGPKSHLIRETMNSISQRLPDDRFIRISRTSIVNIARVRELQPLFHGEYAVILSAGTKLTLSRSFRDRLPKLGLK